MLDSVESLMDEYISSLDSYSYKLYKLLPSGKRLRAKLILKIAKKSSDSIKLSAIVELIHAASLLHDDVIDDATTRRGVASINAIYGNKSAIMLGDILYSKAFSELSSFESKIAKSISNAVTMLSVGELLDVELSKEFNSDLDLYMDMIYKKTAVLIEASAKSAALLSGKNPDSYAIYGKNLGLAFQIIDDILDITQDSTKLGKPALNDFKEGKVTIPYIYLYQRLDESDKEFLRSLYKKELSIDEQNWIKEKMSQYHVIEDTLSLARGLGEDALNAIKSDNDEVLIGIIKDMIEREF